ncbi:alpha-1,3-mannosyl-glycoprotein 4-beta-N-acetylglucosaminyltransferase B [Tribolium castaneum]|uniref:Alpha-1,3-mannosyl-glycoprotein 4-beta-N-acetylglucosaminyltransferase B-like Protein n=1 Tax=Tribolium castaneum TaxID=7070 RepID=D6WG02_TRICA|nr:PREDICTED: alpha-1,3-mannosyl-glycoprotein 4-beta-N-acetylglucosaminyltransferase B [Tribolium castaneum]EFA00960.2 Alpha-1,3-mannosyl-glycoprotein 4-beta-N-acetylglucosaminyltransferase B-like Protein [Tribolium castaneum]|eukprot:XP_008200607.1 PREDICTED: alpha-1,3-mannosyl-glycoprotein 4-beta-N-acetylglucosaminyltransferase B [Tribolium castaneum]
MAVVNFAMSPLRRRNCFLVLAFVVFIPFCAFVLFSVPDITSEQMLIQRLAELQVKLQYLDSMYRARQEDLQQLTQHIDQIGIPNDNTTTFSFPTPELRPEIKQLIKNMSGMHAATGLNPPIMLRLPSSYHFLPHLLDDPSSLRLAYLMSKGRNGVSVVMGVPTVRREKQSYLMDTLQNLIDGMNSAEANDSLIVVFVAETDLEYVLQVAKEIEMRFPMQVDSGLIEVLSPSPAYYPNLDKLRITLGDPPERVRWRSKQNLDFAFLMSYSQPKGTFYLQLEDDILAKPNYVTEMKKFAIEKIARKEPWFVLDFCQLGFIGKMFKSAELPWLIQFFQMFYNDKPVDWLLDHLIFTKVCNWDKNSNCKRDKAKMWVHYKPSLFQHIGTHSSLKGKVQKLKDKQFGKVALFFPHSNPDAEVVSGIKHYKQYTLERAYLGETFFWGLLPSPGDQLIFKFSSPIWIKRFFFRSGNAEHPSDKFYNTTVEVLPAEANQYGNSLNVTSDGYIVVGKFDSVGIATGVPDESIGKIQALRLHVHSESDNWAILSEIHIQDELATR